MELTEKLYDKNAFIRAFEAQVLSCEQEGKRYAVVLSKTAFFPEGGGQGADKGSLGGVPVEDVQEKAGVIYHYVRQPLNGEVQGVLDWQTRFDRMQNHSGEHVLSGIIHRHTGADNISFSLTDTETTLAFNTSLNADLLAQVEKEANQAVFENRAITAAYPEKEQLKNMEYRSKLALSEHVRIVEIEGIDRCACCAPHCAATGQIGLIKIIGAEPYKGGTKLWIVCGMRALAHHAMLLEQAKAISHLLCAKMDTIGSAVERLHGAKEGAEYALVALRREAIQRAVEAVEATPGDYAAFCEFKGDDLRLFAESLKEKIGGVIAVLEGGESEGYRYVITTREGDIQAYVQRANAALNGRGGGRGQMARGSFSAGEKEIREYFKF